MNRAQCHYDQGNFDKSIEDLQSGLQHAKEDQVALVLYKLGLSHYAH